MVISQSLSNGCCRKKVPVKKNPHVPREREQAECWRHRFRYAVRCAADMVCTAAFLNLIAAKM